MREPWVFETMGTVVSLRADVDAATVDRVRAVFTDADARFSLYHPDSELSGIRDQRLRLTEASADLRAVYALANDWRLATDGAFTPHRPDGVIDLDGVVKAWAMDRAARELGTDWCLNVGGDVLVSGVRPDGASWSLGIVDPGDRGALLTTLVLGPRSAAATSGSSERGEHIWTRAGGTAEFAQATEFIQATVLAGDILTADVLATAIISGGRQTLDAVTERFDVDVLTVDRFGSLMATPGLLGATVLPG